jgi:hypothetical protein
VLGAPNFRGIENTAIPFRFRSLIAQMYNLAKIPKNLVLILKILCNTKTTKTRLPNSLRMVCVPQKVARCRVDLFKSDLPKLPEVSFGVPDKRGEHFLVGVVVLIRLIVGPSNASSKHICNLNQEIALGFYISDFSNEA